MNPPRRSINLRDLIGDSRNDELAIGTADFNPSLMRRAGTIMLPYSTRAAHMHVIGRTRSGKSRFIADLIRQDITNGAGCTVIDPHGELYDLTVNWLAQNQSVMRPRKNIHPVCFTDEATAFRYNPLHIDRQEEAYAVASNVTNAITRVYGGKDATETPLIWFVLDVTCTILALRGLPLAAGKYFLMNSAFDRDLRNKISEGVANPYYRELGLEMSRRSPREFRETVESTGRRLHQFINNPMIERIFSTTENTANLRQIMDERHVLLLNTSDQGGLIDFNQLRTIGMLFVNNIFAYARKRDPKTKPVPHFLYIDEAQNYLSNDIENILSQAAKRGLYMTLSHQFLGQLVEAGQLVYNGVMSGTLMKAVFGVTMEDADVFVDELFADRIDFERVKEKLKSPHVVGHEVVELKGSSKGRSDAVMHSRTRASASSESEGESETDGYSFGSSTSDTDGAANTIISVNSKSTYVPDDPGLSALGVTLGTSKGGSKTTSTSSSTTENEGYSRTTTRTSNYSNTTSEAESDGTSTSFSEGASIGETIKPVIEWFSTTAYSLEEQRYALKREIAFQQERHGFLAVRRKGTIGFTSREVSDPLEIPQSEAKLLARLISESPWISPAGEVPDVLDHPVLAAILKATKRATPEPDDYFESDEHPPFEEEESPRPARSAKSAPKAPPPRGSRKS